MSSFKTLKFVKQNLLITVKIGMKPVQTLAGIRHRLPALLKDPKLEPLCWVAVYGPFSRNQQTRTSDIDMAVGYKPDFDTYSLKFYDLMARVKERGSKVFGRKVNVEPVYNDDLTYPGYDTVDALLTGVTVYGREDWPEFAQSQAREMLDNGYARLRKAYHIMGQIEQALMSTNRNVSKFSFLISLSEEISLQL
jgi:predicted nucleotidyltransferase